MRKRIIMLIVILIGITGLFFSFPTNQTSANLGDDYIEDFEGYDDFEWDCTGLWHIEDNSTSSTPIDTWIPSPQHYMWYGSNLTGDYDTGTDTNSGTLTSDLINLTLFEGIIKLKFWSWAITEEDPSYDLKYVEISPDNGLNWVFLNNISVSSDWEYYSIDITEYGYSSDIRIRFTFETVDELNNNFIGWRLDDIEIIEEPGYFDLNIYQGYYALPNESKIIDFEIWSHFNQDKNINISISMIHPSGEKEILLSNPFEYIERLNKWFYSIEYHFTNEGDYCALLEVRDDSGGYWYTECYWKIGPYLELKIEQEYHALLNDIREMKFWIINYYTYGMYLDIYVNVTSPYGYTSKLSESYDYYISEKNVYDFSLEYTFTELGYYRITFFVIDDYERIWTTECLWEIGPYFDMWIDDEGETKIGQEKLINFYIKSYFDYDVYVDISIVMFSPSGEQNLYQVNHVYLITWSTWSENISYIFTEPGKYNVQFLVIDESNRWWEYWYCWGIREKFDLWITQENYAEIGEEKSMEFHLQAYFNHDMQIRITILIITPNDDKEILYEEYPVYIPAFGSWDHSLSYVFNEAGDYKVLFIIKDDKETEWITDCFWTIKSDQDASSTRNKSTSDDIISPGFEGIIITLAFIGMVIYYKRQK